MGSDTSVMVRGGGTDRPGCAAPRAGAAEHPEARGLQRRGRALPRVGRGRAVRQQRRLHDRQRLWVRRGGRWACMHACCAGRQAVILHKGERPGTHGALLRLALLWPPLHGTARRALQPLEHSNNSHFKQTTSQHPTPLLAGWASAARHAAGASPASRATCSACRPTARPLGSCPWTWRRGRLFETSPPQSRPPGTGRRLACADLAWGPLLEPNLPVIRHQELFSHRCRLFIGIFDCEPYLHPGVPWREPGSPREFSCSARHGGFGAVPRRACADPAVGHPPPRQPTARRASTMHPV